MRRGSAGEPRGPRPPAAARAHGLRQREQRPHGRCDTPGGPGAIRRIRGDLRRPGSALQRAVLPRVPSEPGERRTEPGARAAGRPQGPRRGLSEPGDSHQRRGGGHQGALAREPTRDRPQRRLPHHRYSGAGAGLREHTHLSHLGEPARRRLRGGGRRFDPDRALQKAVQGDARPDLRARSLRPGGRVPGHYAHRALRLEGSAREPSVLLGRCLSQRDGHHQRIVSRRGDQPLQHGERAEQQARGRRARGHRSLHALRARHQGPGARRPAGRDPRGEAGRGAVCEDRL